MGASTIIKTYFSPARLLGAIRGESFSFHFPRDLGTPDLLQLAMKCGPAPIAVAFDTPALESVATTFAGGLAIGLTKRLTLGRLELPAALKKSRGMAALAFFSSPSADADVVQLRFFDSQGIPLNEWELRELVQENPFPATTRLSPALSGVAA